MTTATTSTVIDQSTDAAFRTWIAEMIAQWVTACGLTQTADTGQVNTSTVVRGTAGTSAGYIILRFNDTLQSTSPVFLKLEFGSTGTNTTPMMWLTVGTGSNGSGTLTGTLTTRVALLNAQAPTSTSTSYTSRFCYNSTFGVAWFAWKQNANGTAAANGFYGGAYIGRSNDATGAATSNALLVITNSSTAAGGASGCGVAQCINFAGATVAPSVASGAYIGAASSNGVPYGQTTTTQAGNSYTVPVYYLDGNAPTVSAFISCPLTAETAVGSTMSVALVGSSALTFLQCGGMFGSATSLGSVISASVIGLAPLWQ